MPLTAPLPHQFEGRPSRYIALHFVLTCRRSKLVLSQQPSSPCLTNAVTGYHKAAPLLRNPIVTKREQNHNISHSSMLQSTSTPSMIDKSVSPPSSSAHEIKLDTLWVNAVEDYISRARLSEKEKSSLRRITRAEDVVNLTRHGWEQNIIQKRGKNHDILVRTVSQVLGVFGIIDATLRFTVLLLPSFRNQAYLTEFFTRFCSLCGNTSVTSGVPP
jgi:hypothetical protein